MSIKKQANGKYLLEMYPNGRTGKRIRKTFTTKSEAVRFEAYTLEQYNNTPWNPKQDKTRLSELINIWFELHGQSLTGGESSRKKLQAVAEACGDPLAKNFNRAIFTDYRKARLEKVKAKTINNEHTYLNAMFNELVRMEQWPENPIKGLRQLKYIRPDMGFLTPDEIPVLLEELGKSRNPDALIISKICLSTGCRWGEAESLKADQITPHRLRFVRTKGNKVRTVPISKELYDEIPKKKGSLFSSSWGAFRKAITRAEIELPDGQMSHVLRHTFASHFMQKGGNILVLQQILGHSSITDTMKYSHFAPTHLEDAVKLNPLVTD